MFPCADSTTNFLFLFFENEAIVIQLCSEIQSKYSASRAGGGESSSHTISKSTWVANWAKEWATALAPRLTQLIVRLLKLEAKVWISS